MSTNFRTNRLPSKVNESVEDRDENHRELFVVEVGEGRWESSGLTEKSSPYRVDGVEGGKGGRHRR